ncbi:pyocin knob domain-containing protein [Pectobacterium aroidearum]|uniref:pyocin knob domain-containing protein n=1 Tax=Pectobacterium aroidearum TaxID=1201031 RepID=UPI003307127D
MGETVDLAAGALQKTGGVMSGGVRLGGNLDMPLEKRLTGIFSDDTYREMLWLASDNSIQVGDVKSEIAIRTKGSLNILINDKWYQGYHTGFKPTAADIGAITKQETDNNYVRQGSSAVVYKDDDLTWNSPTGAYLKKNEGYTSLIWHMGLNVGSASAAQFYFDYANGGLKYRSSRDNHGFEKPWARIYSDQDKPTADEIGAIAFHGGLSQDLNSVFTPGVYCNVYDAYATSEHHYPIAFAGSLFIYLNSANGRNGVTQEYRPYNSNKLFRRFYYVSSASWSVWAEEYNTQNRPTAEDVGALPVGGVATAASKLAIARKINGVLFDGTEDINIASGWSKVASGSVNYPLVNSQTKSFVGTIDTGVATTSWIHDLKKYAVVLSSKGNQVVTSNPNNCSWGASAELRSMTRFYGKSTILIDVFTYGQNLQSGSVSTWELWEIVS